MAIDVGSVLKSMWSRTYEYERIENESIQTRKNKRSTRETQEWKVSQHLFIQLVHMKEKSIIRIRRMRIDSEMN